MIHRLLLHPGDQLLFCVALRGSGAALELRVNDVPVFRETDGTPFQITLPINEWLFQGENEIRLEAGAGATQAEARLCYRRLRQPLKSLLSLCTLEVSSRHAAAPASEARRPRLGLRAEEMPVLLPGEEGEFDWREAPASRRPDGTLSLAGTFSLPRPWPVCPWAEGEMMDGQINLRHSVRRFIEDLRGCLARRDLALIMKVAAVRAASLESAYYLDAAEVEEAMFFPRLIQTPDWQVAPLREDEWQLEIAGQGRLVRVIEEASGESPLRLLNQNEKLEAVVDAWWAFTHRWVLMR